MNELINMASGEQKPKVKGRVTRLTGPNNGVRGIVDRGRL